MRPLLLVLLWLLPSVAFAQEDQITLPSAHSAPETIQRLQQAIRANGFTILATIDYAAYAAEMGVKIPARTTISFGWMEGWTHMRWSRHRLSPLNCPTGFSFGRTTKGSG